ncbi:MAG: acetyl-coenzyme A synthetase N-terminal domain-containing protein, partial [Methyloceanibacter sp.]
MNHVGTSASTESSPEGAGAAFIDEALYSAMYEASMSDPDKFWAKQAERIDWITPFTKVKNTSFVYPDVSIKWFED